LGHDAGKMDLQSENRANKPQALRDRRLSGSGNRTVCRLLQFLLLGSGDSEHRVDRPATKIGRSGRRYDCNRIAIVRADGKERRFITCFVLPSRSRQTFAAIWCSECFEDFRIGLFADHSDGSVTHQKLSAVPGWWPAETDRRAIDAVARISQIGGMSPRPE